jgi:hypothetical protein
MPALEQAPALPTGCVDFNKLHEACLKGSPDPLKHAVIVTESPISESETSEPVSAAKADKE